MEERTWKEMRTKVFWALEVRLELLKDAKPDFMTTSYLLSCGTVDAYRTIGLITPQEADDWGRRLREVFFGSDKQVE